MKYDNETIILIEYYKGIPHSVYTELNGYDFNLHVNGWLMFCNTSGGRMYEERGEKKIIEREFRYCTPEDWSIWVDSQYTIHPPEIQKGVTVLKKPLMLSVWLDSSEKHNSPFITGEEVLEIYYCKKCDGYYTDSGCPDHEWKEE